MQRVTRSTAVAVMPAIPASPGLPGFFTGGDPLSSIPATIPGYEWHNGVQEEIIAAIEDGGQTALAADLQQLRRTIRRMTGRNVAVATASANLNVDHQGIVLVSAAAGNVVITLPAANAMGGRPIAFTVIRTDAVPSNSVTVQRAGTDTIEGVNSVALLPGARLSIISDTSATWYRTALDSFGVMSLTATATLTPAQRGMVLVNATSGPIVITLPAAGAGPNAYTFVRTDASANSVTIQRAGTDTIEGAASAALLALERLQLTADAVGTWRATAEGRFNASFGATGYQKIPNSAGGALILQWGGSRPGDIATADSGNITFPRAFPNACRRVLVTAYGEPTQVNNQVVQLYGAPSTTGFTYGRYEFNVTNTPGAGFEWLAIGD